MAKFDPDAMDKTGGFDGEQGEKFSYMPVQTKPGQFRTTSSKDATWRSPATIKSPGKPAAMPKSFGKSLGRKGRGKS